MKRIFLLAAIAICGITAQAQNKIFSKYSDMKGVEYVCINKSLFSAGLAIATAGQVIVDNADTEGSDLSKLTNFNRMLIITAKDSKKAELYADIQKLAKDKDYEVMMESHSADGNNAIFLHNEQSSPSEFIICNTSPEDCSVVVFLKDK